MNPKLIAIPLCLLLLAACTQPPKPVTPTVIRPEAKVLDAAARQALKEVRADGTLVFAPVAASSTAQAINPKQFKPGDIIVSEPTPAAPYGLLRKVVVPADDGGEVTVRTSQAQIGDAIQKGSLRADYTLSAADLEEVVPAQGVQLSAVRSQEVKLFDRTISLVVLDKDGNDKTTNDRVTAAGQISLEAGFKIDLDLDCNYWCLYDNDLDFLGQVKAKLSTKIKISGEALLGSSIKKTLPIANLNFKAKTFYIGLLPVVITPRIVLELRFDGSVGIKVSYEAGQTLTAVAGVKYDDKWQSISELTSEPFAGPVDASIGVAGALEAKVKAAARGELLLYGVIGPTLEIAPFIGLDLMYPRDPLWKLNAGIQGNVGIKIEVLGYSKHFQTNLWDNSVEIARAGNQAPSLAFIRPTGGDVQAVACCTLLVSVSDPEDGIPCCQVSFKSSNSLDGVGGILGNGSGTLPELVYSFSTLGPRTITATAVDSKGLSKSTSVDIEVVNTPPTLAIQVPFSNQQLYQGLSYTMRGLSYDLNETGYQLGCTALRWTTNLSADGEKTGCEPSIVFNSSGPRTLTLKGQDSHGASSSASVNIMVLDKPANLPPVVNLSSPKNNLSIGPNTVLQLTGQATDPEGGAVKLEWDVTTDYDPQTGQGAQTYSVTPAANGEWKPSDSIAYSPTPCSGNSDGYGTLRLRLKAKDPEGNEGLDFIVLAVPLLC